MFGDMFAIQIGTGKDNYLVDMQTHNDGIKFEKVIPFIEGKTMVFHNATFDLGFFYKHNFFPRDVYDTFLGSKLLHVGAPPYIRHGFGFVMERELKQVYDKSEQKNIHINQLRTSKAIQYCFNDVDRLLELGRVLIKKLTKNEMMATYMLHNNYARALAYIEQCGLPIAEDLWLHKIEDDKANLEEKRIEVIEYIYDNYPKFRDMQVDLFKTEKKILPSITSPKQMIPVFKEMGINVINKDGKESTKKDVLQKTGHEFNDIWFGFQDFKSDCSTFGENILEKIVDGRIYTSYNPILNTARISTRKNGINFLNFPANEKTRECFRTTEGWKMIVCDYDGQENVVGADLHNDAAMVASILDDKDLHCAFARLLFPELEEVDDDTIKDEHKSKRDYAKPPRFAFAYGGNGFTIANNLNIPLKEGQRIESLFRKLHEGIYSWGKEVYKKAVQVGYIESADGFKLQLEYFEEFKALEEEIKGHSREFWDEYREGKAQYVKMRENRKAMEADPTIEPYEIEDDFSYETYISHKSSISRFFSKKSAYERLCLNNPVQATSAHQTKAAVVKIFDTILDEGDLWKAKICVVPHDEIVMETTDELADKYRVILQESMISEGNKYLKRGIVHMAATANVGVSWYEAK